jgi:hypothetical protein
VNLSAHNDPDDHTVPSLHVSCVSRRKIPIQERYFLLGNPGWMDHPGDLMLTPIPREEFRHDLDS